MERQHQHTSHDGYERDRANRHDRTVDHQRLVRRPSRALAARAYRFQPWQRSFEIQEPDPEHEEGGASDSSRLERKPQAPVPTVRLMVRRPDSGSEDTREKRPHQREQIAPWQERVKQKQNTAPCAFAEGFADFFSAWIDNARQGSYAYSDYGFERTNWGTADGKFDEGRVAGFLYNVVDDGTELDGVSNTAVGDDDSMHLAASWLAQLMRNCSLRDPSTTITKLSSIDQLVYCMEGDMSALSDPTQPGSWTYYSSVTPNTATPAGWDKNKLRALWHCNLYSVGLLP